MIYLSTDAQDELDPSNSSRSSSPYQGCSDVTCYTFPATWMPRTDVLPHREQCASPHVLSTCWDVLSFPRAPVGQLQRLTRVLATKPWCGHRTAITIARELIEEWEKTYLQLTRITECLATHFIMPVYRYCVPYYELHLVPFCNAVTLLQNDVNPYRKNNQLVNDSLQRYLRRVDVSYAKMWHDATVEIFLTAECQLPTAECLLCSKLAYFPLSDEPSGGYGFRCFRYSIHGILATKFVHYLVCDEPAVICDPELPCCPMITVNESFTALTQYSASELCGESMSLLHSDPYCGECEPGTMEVRGVLLVKDVLVTKDHAAVEIRRCGLKFVIHGYTFLLFMYIKSASVRSACAKLQTVGFAKYFLHKVLTEDGLKRPTELRRMVGYILPNSRGLHHHEEDDDELNQESIFTVHRSERAKIPTLFGMTDHPVGCTPCIFFCYSVNGCVRGAECAYCHKSDGHVSRRLAKRLTYRELRLKRKKRQKQAQGELEKAPPPTLKKRAEKLSHVETPA